MGARFPDRSRRVMMGRRRSLTQADHPSLIATTSQDKYYRPLLMRYIKNEAQSEVAKATRGGKSLP